jgi:hypothetical protein
LASAKSYWSLLRPWLRPNLIRLRQNLIGLLGGPLASAKSYCPLLRALWLRLKASSGASFSLNHNITLSQNYKPLLICITQWKKNFPKTCLLLVTRSTASWDRLSGFPHLRSLILRDWGVPSKTVNQNLLQTPLCNIWHAGKRTDEEETLYSLFHVLVHVICRSNFEYC